MTSEIAENLLYLSDNLQVKFMNSTPNMKSDKYYTDRSRLKRELIWVVLIPLLFSGLLLINLLRWYYEHDGEMIYL